MRNFSEKRNASPPAALPSASGTSAVLRGRARGPAADRLPVPSWVSSEFCFYMKPAIKVSCEFSPIYLLFFSLLIYEYELLTLSNSLL
jgi:hypothetical protein